MENKILSQEEITQLLTPLFQSEGKLFKKVKVIHARPAKEGEQITTETSDGIETQNTAKKGDFIIQNQTEAKEEYIIGASKFDDRYSLKEQLDDRFSVYEPKGKVVAIKMTADYLEKLNLPNSFFIMAPWNEKMIVKKDDYLVCPPDFSEIYRIAQKEFLETYDLETS